jgi:hypothetical protein
MAAIIGAQGLSEQGADARFTALINVPWAPTNRSGVHAYLGPKAANSNPASSESAASCAWASVLAVYTRSVIDGSA